MFHMKTGMVGGALALSLCLGGLFAGAEVVSAQERSVTLAQFEATLKTDDMNLATVEAAFDKLAAAKAQDEKDKIADVLESGMTVYTRGMSASISIATREAGLAMKSEGKQGSVELLKAFEDLAQRHEKRMKAVDDRAKKMNPKAGSLWNSATETILALDGSSLKAIGDFIVSPAEAAIALGVYAACHQNPPNQAACAGAIASGITQTQAAQATYNKCWSGLDGVRPKWWRAARRAGCVAGLVARLA